MKGQGWTEARGEGVKGRRGMGGLKHVVRALKGWRDRGGRMRVVNIAMSTRRVGHNRIYIYTVYERIFRGFPAKSQRYIHTIYV